MNEASIAPRPLPTSRPAARHPARLLLVTDHEDSGKTLVRLMQRAGHQVALAGKGEDALAALQEGTFDLLISDIGLPDMSGFELMREVTARNGPRGITLTGYGHDCDYQQSAEAGFLRHLVKPVQASFLLHTIDELMAEGAPPKDA